MLVAAVFPADPVDGFPVGTSGGSSHDDQHRRGSIHFIAGSLEFCLPRDQLPRSARGDVAPEGAWGDGATLALLLRAFP